MAVLHLYAVGSAWSIGWAIGGTAFEDFEYPTSNYIYDKGNEFFPDWVVSSTGDSNGRGVVVIKNGAGAWGGLDSGSGDSFVGLKRATVSIERTLVSLVPGSVYKIGFLAACRPGSSSMSRSDDCKLTLSVDGVSLSGQLSPEPSFQHYDDSFTATSTAATIRFSNEGMAAGDICTFLDAIKITPPPPPLHGWPTFWYMPLSSFSDDAGTKVTSVGTNPGQWTGTVHEGAVLGEGSAPGWKALSFVNEEQYISFGGDTEIGGGALTICARVRLPLANGGFPQIVGFGTGTDNKITIQSVGFGPDTDNVARIEFYIWYSGQAKSTIAGIKLALNIIDDYEKWMHFCLSVDSSGEMRAFKNGKAWTCSNPNVGNSACRRSTGRKLTRALRPGSIGKGSKLAISDFTVIDDHAVTTEGEATAIMNYKPISTTSTTATSTTSTTITTATVTFTTTTTATATSTTSTTTTTGLCNNKPDPPLCLLYSSKIAKDGEICNTLVVNVLLSHTCPVACGVCTTSSTSTTTTTATTTTSATKTSTTLTTTTTTTATYTTPAPTTATTTTTTTTTPTAAVPLAASTLDERPNRQNAIIGALAAAFILIAVGGGAVYWRRASKKRNDAAALYLALTTLNIPPAAYALQRQATKRGSSKILKQSAATTTHVNPAFIGVVFDSPAGDGVLGGTSSATDDYEQIQDVLTDVLKLQPWFHGHLTTASCEKVLTEAPSSPGTFLVRDTPAGDTIDVAANMPTYTLSYRTVAGITVEEHNKNSPMHLLPMPATRHHLISKDPETMMWKLRYTDNPNVRPFSNVMQLVEFYQSTPATNKNAVEQVASVAASGMHMIAETAFNDDLADYDVATTSGAAEPEATRAEQDATAALVSTFIKQLERDGKGVYGIVVLLNEEDELNGAGSAEPITAEDRTFEGGSGSEYLEVIGVLSLAASEPILPVDSAPKCTPPTMLQPSTAAVALPSAAPVPLPHLNNNGTDHLEDHTNGFVDPPAEMVLVDYVPCLSIEASNQQPDSKFVAPMMVLGKNTLSARGLSTIMGVDPRTYRDIRNKVAKIMNEFARSGTPEDNANVDRLMKGTYSNPETPEDVLPSVAEVMASSEEVRIAGLEIHHVLALRLYTTSSYKSINDPMRQQPYPQLPHPFAATLYYISDALTKLRTVQGATQSHSNKAQVFWRGMVDLCVTDEFLAVGGTEMSCMSTTSSKKVAADFAKKSKTAPLLFKLISNDFMSHGADISFLSVYPKEKENLYPPLTYLGPVSSEITIEVIDGREYQVIHVQPSFGSLT